MHSSVGAFGSNKTRQSTKMAFRFRWSEVRPASVNPHLKGFILAWPLVGALGWILYFITCLPFFQ